MMAYIFTTEPEATAAAAALEPYLRAALVARGFTPVPGNGVLAKSAATGADVPGSDISTIWGPVAETISGDFCIPSIRDMFPEAFGSIEVTLGLPRPVDVELTEPVS